MRGRTKELFTNEKVLLAFRIILGSIFIAASVGKLSNLDQFATLVASYNILPHGLSTVYGYLMPWLELFIGSFLILGIFTRFASALSIPIIISFVIANSYQLLIGAGGSCGCFGDVIPLTLSQSLNLDALMLLFTVPLIIRKTRLLSVEQWLIGSEHRRPKRGWFAFGGAGKALAVITFVALLLSASPQTAQAAVTADPNVSPSSVSLDAQISTALESNEAAFLFFYTDWCGFCKQQKPVLDALEPEFSDDIAIIRVNADENRQAMQQFGVTGFPTMILITGTNPDGSYIQQTYTGFTNETELRSIFNQAITGVVAAEPSASIPIDTRIDAALESSESASLFFYADWCGFCKQQKPVIDALEQQYSGQISILRLNNEAEADAFTEFGVTGFPTLYLITGKDASGDYISQKYVGYTEEGVLAAAFDLTISGGPTLLALSIPVNQSAITCFGIASTDPAVCNGGDCTAQDTCVCPEGWMGSNCQLQDKWTCGGIDFDDPSVCSGYGVCGEQGTCTCYEGYTGENCESVASSCERFPPGNGIPYTDPAACGDFGTCTANETCVCDPGYYTADPANPCEGILTCGPFAADMPWVCGGNGVCVDDGNGEIGVCECAQGWTGENCDEQLTCFGLSYYDSQVCGGMGECVGIDVCECIPGVEGMQCSFDNRMCDGILYWDNGVCGGRGDCIDIEGTGDYQCVCDDGYMGSSCWLETTCNNIPAGHPDVCGGNGACVAQDVCECDYPYTGEWCTEVIECGGVPATDPNVCSGSGICTINGTCACDAEHMGVICSIPVDLSCGGLPAGDPNACGGSGECVAQDSCVCEEGYIGDNCENKLQCYGVDYDDPNVCSGLGTCNLDGTCTCDANWAGADCSTYTGTTCGGQHPDSPGVCSGNGECVEQDTCVCVDG